jgi:hypothetical protein
MDGGQLGLKPGATMSVCTTAVGWEYLGNCERVKKRDIQAKWLRAIEGRF